MKITHLKSYSLLFIMSLFSMFFSSCSKEDHLPDEPNLEATSEERVPLLLPANLSENQKNSYVRNASMKELTQMQKDYVIAEFLKEKNKLQELTKGIVGEKSLSDLNLRSILNNDDFRNLETKLADIERDHSARGGWATIADVYELDWCVGGNDWAVCSFSYSHTELTICFP